MKMTMHIDEALLAEVMAATGAKSKTAAVNEALRKIASRFRQRERWSRDLGLTPEQIGAGFDADVALGLRGHKPPLTKAELLGEAPVKHGKKRSR